MLTLIWCAALFLTCWSLLFMAILVLRRAYAGWVGRRLRAARSRLVKAVIAEKDEAALEARLRSVRLRALAHAGGDVLDMISGPKREALARVMCARGADRILTRAARRGSLHQRLRAVEVLGHLPGEGPDRILSELRNSPGTGAVRIAAAIALAERGSGNVSEAVAGLGSRLLSHPRTDDLMRALVPVDPLGVRRAADDPRLPRRFRAAAARAVSDERALDTGTAITPQTLTRLAS